MLAVVLGLLLQIGPPMPQPMPPNVTVENRTILQAPQPDPEVVAENSVTAGQAMLTGIAAPPLVEWTNDLLNLPDFYRTTPPELTYGHPEIRTLSEQMRTVAFGLLILVVAGMAICMGFGVVSIADAPWHVVYALGRAAANLTLWEWGIQLNNMICAAIGAPDLPGIIRPRLELSINPVEHGTNVVLVIVTAVVALLLLANLIFRIGLIEVLIAIGPLASICKALPQTEGFTALYDRLAIGLLFSQIMIVIGLKTSSVLIPLSPLMAIFVLLLLRRLPALATQTGNQGGRSMLGSLAGRLILRRLAR